MQLEYSRKENGPWTTCYADIIDAIHAACELDELEDGDEITLYSRGLQNFDISKLVPDVGQFIQARIESIDPDHAGAVNNIEYVG